MVTLVAALSLSGMSADGLPEDDSTPLMVMVAVASVVSAVTVMVFVPEGSVQVYVFVVVSNAGTRSPVDSTKDFKDASSAGAGGGAVHFPSQSALS